MDKKSKKKECCKIVLEALATFLSGVASSFLATWI